MWRKREVNILGASWRIKSGNQNKSVRTTWIHHMNIRSPSPPKGPLRPSPPRNGLAEGKLYHARVVAVPNQRKQRIEVGERDAIADGCLPIADWLTGFPVSPQTADLFLNKLSIPCFTTTDGMIEWQTLQTVNHTFLDGLCGSLANYCGLHRQI